MGQKAGESVRPAARGAGLARAFELVSRSLAGLYCTAGVGTLIDASAARRSAGRLAEISVVDVRRSLSRLEKTSSASSSRIANPSKSSLIAIW
jgi:hypothetical protein